MCSFGDSRLASIAFLDTGLSHLILHAPGPVFFFFFSLGSHTPSLRPLSPPYQDMCGNTSLVLALRGSAARPPGLHGADGHVP